MPESGATTTSARALAYRCTTAVEIIPHLPGPQVGGEAVQQFRLNFGGHALANFLLREFDGKPGGKALHVELRLLAGRLNFQFRLAMNAGDFSLAFAADALRFAVPLLSALARSTAISLARFASFS